MDAAFNLPPSILHQPALGPAPPTPRWTRVFKPGELMAEWVAGIPMGRVGVGEDIAGPVAFLASDNSAYITGQTLSVDGGMHT